MRRLTPARPQTAPGLYARVEAVSAELDQLLGEISLGLRGPAHFDAIEERASNISRRLRAAFRQKD